MRNFLSNMMASSTIDSKHRVLSTVEWEQLIHLQFLESKMEAKQQTSLRIESFIFDICLPRRPY